MTGLLAGALPALAQVPEGAARTAALPRAPNAEDLTASIPRPLAATDADRYRAIFALQDRGDWRAADRLVGELTDLRLLGHVLAHRYLHPTLYRSSYRELRDWLARYADHPDAPAIHRLATRRKPVGEAPPREPAAATPAPAGAPDTGLVAEGPAWDAALASWRRGRIDEAARRFESVATAGTESPWNRSAAAFWAARSHLRAGRPEQVSHWLAMAAEHPRTFYGQLARRALGMDAGFDWAVPPLAQAQGRGLLRSRGGQRALALLQIGQSARAEREMQVLYAAAGPELAEALFAISQAAAMPSLALQLGGALERRTGRRPDAALYPLPVWTPDGGFTIDRALLYALMRQESAFNPEAQSPAGAAGLMQLMPETAGHVVGNNGHFTGSRLRQLLDPELNLTLAQTYLHQLLAEESVRGDLLLLTVAYNAGPGSVAKWRAQGRIAEDPLLFVESIPSRETRQFVERVLTNFWVYQQRLGQPTPSLDALAAGVWPVYAPPGETSRTTAASDGGH